MGGVRVSETEVLRERVATLEAARANANGITLSREGAAAVVAILEQTENPTRQQRYNLLAELGIRERLAGVV